MFVASVLSTWYVENTMKVILISMVFKTLRERHAENMCICDIEISRDVYAEKLDANIFFPNILLNYIDIFILLKQGISGFECFSAVSTNHIFLFVY